MGAEIFVTVDQENNAEEWWDALRAHPNGKQLEAAIDAGAVSSEQLKTLQSLPGWAGSSKHAPHPLVVRQ